MAERRGRFNDEKSQAQIAVYHAHRMLGADDRNERNLRRWSADPTRRTAWELYHLGTARRRTP